MIVSKDADGFFRVVIDEHTFAKLHADLDEVLTGIVAINNKMAMQGVAGLTQTLTHWERNTAVVCAEIAVRRDSENKD